MKQCRDCVHYRPASQEVDGFGFAIVRRAECNVTDFVGDGCHLLSCAEERFSNDERACGRDAKHWEAKP